MVVGDLHGQLADLLTIFTENGYPSPHGARPGFLKAEGTSAGGGGYPARLHSRTPLPNRLSPFTSQQSGPSLCVLFFLFYILFFCKMKQMHSDLFPPFFPAFFSFVAALKPREPEQAHSVPNFAGFCETFSPVVARECLADCPSGGIFFTAMELSAVG